MSEPGRFAAGRARLRALAGRAEAHGRPPWEIRLLRFAVGFIIIGAAISTLDTVLNTDKPILDKNKLEVGMMIGWIIAKSGTIIDWLFGGSESGTRRADAQAQQPSGQPEDPVHTREEDAK